MPMDWAFVRDNDKSAPPCYKMDSFVLESNDELSDLRKQCEVFVMNNAPRALHSESVCSLSRDGVRQWISTWKRPLLSEVSWTAEGLICKVSVTVPHWDDPDMCCFITFLHNGSWCVCRCIKGGPELRKCQRSLHKTGIYLSSWDVSQRSMGEKCSCHAIHFNSEFSWKLKVAE